MSDAKPEPGESDDTFPMMRLDLPTAEQRELYRCQCPLCRQAR